MTTLDIPATITAIAAVVTAVGFIVTAVLTYLNRKASRDAAKAALAAQTAIESSKADLVETAKGIFEVGKKLDGRLSELLESATVRARLEGRAEGEQAQRDRASEATR